MGVALRLVNFDELFYKKATREPFIVNHVSESSEDDKDKLNKLIYTKYTGNQDLLSNLPTCECGEIVGEHNVGLFCRNCQTHVQPPMNQELEPIVWIQSPIGVKALINPALWTMLNDRFNKSGFEIIRWLVDTSYKTDAKMPEVMNAVMALGIPRGYNFFVEHFDEIIEALFNLKDFKWKKTPEDPLLDMIKRFRDCVFCQYLPIINRSLLVIEETNTGTFVDPVLTGAVDAARTMVAIDSPLNPSTLRVKENRTIKAVSQLAEFYALLYGGTLSGKTGVLRKHVYGTRAHFSFRAVISSLTDAHDYDELHVSWGIGVAVLWVHLVSKLFRRINPVTGHIYTPNEAFALLNEHIEKYNPLLDELFHELIREAPNGRGISVCFQRNPSLERGSAQLMYITKIKTDAKIPTVDLSILAVKGLNADFDGDQLNATLSIDVVTEKELRRMAPHMSTFDLNAPRKVSKNLSIPKPVVGTIGAWFHHEDRHIVDPVILDRMQQLPSA